MAFPGKLLCYVWLNSFSSMLHDSIDHLLFSLMSRVDSSQLFYHLMICSLNLQGISTPCTNLKITQKHTKSKWKQENHPLKAKVHSKITNHCSCVECTPLVWRSAPFLSALLHAYKCTLLEHIPSWWRHVTFLNECMRFLIACGDAPRK